MTYTVTQREVKTGEDKFAIVDAKGEVWSTHPTRKGADKLAAKLNSDSEALDDFNYVGSRHHY